jgi:type IV secretory pathway TraG/TraD family ATPase VirD4
MMVALRGVIVVSRIMSGRKDRCLYMATSLKPIRCYFSLYYQYYNMSNNFKIKQPGLELNLAGAESVKKTV